MVATGPNSDAPAWDRQLAWQAEARQSSSPKFQALRNPGRLYAVMLAAGQKTMSDSGQAAFASADSPLIGMESWQEPFLPR
jgi:hypothetical protein